MLTAEATSISLGLDHDQPCADFAAPLYLQLSRGNYDRCSVLPLPETIETWRAAHRTARKRADRAERLGYRFAEINRANYGDDIYAINTSLQERQGRPMSAGYREHVQYPPDPSYPCPLHAVRAYGVLKGETLVAYLWLYRAGDLALVSSILGHGDHLADDVMYLLMQGTIAQELAWETFLVYNRWDSGTDGLRYYKTRCGFEEREVRWEA